MRSPLAVICAFLEILDPGIGLIDETLYSGTIRRDDGTVNRRSIIGKIIGYCDTGIEVTKELTDPVQATRRGSARKQGVANRILRGRLPVVKSKIDFCIGVTAAVRQKKVVQGFN